MKVLNLYSGLGGNRKHWTNCEVTAVENSWEIGQVYKSLFPNDRLVCADAHQFLLNHYKEYDFIWSSPPCPTHSRMQKATRHQKKSYPDMSLYQEIIFLKHFFKGKWVVENVKPYYKPLIEPTKAIGRHLFWANFEIGNIDIDNHPNFIKADSPEEIESLKEWLGINYTGNIYYKDNHSPGQVLRNCVHPDIGLHVFSAS